ncbi:MAG: FAD-dependent oxidoreductase [Nitrosomonas sp.]|nr:FAD-dependent oxidoreductase [Nitrosomonas sp.]MCW5607464.1 FAD-dependent oxidoreductase [Nitrosomonas sp.]
MTDPIVIIGSGLAGYAVARELRKLNTEQTVLLLSDNHADFYSKPMLSNALSTGKTPDAIINSHAVKMASQLDITIRPNCRVFAIDKVNRTIAVQDKEQLIYEKLVLALGADQIRLPLQGNGVRKILTVNDIDDYRHFRNTLVDKKKIVIIGAGLIGCEFANDLAAAGYQVEVIDVAGQPLGRLLPLEAGIFMQQNLEAIGVSFRFNATVQSVDQIGEQLRLILADGDTIESDIVLSSIGLKPRIEMAREAGLQVNRGITVNQLLQTSDEHIFALGDCAEVVGKVLPFVMPITHAARALAATLIGNETPVRYPAMPVLVKTPACPTIVSPPEADKPGKWEIESDENGVKALFKSETGNLLGFALLGKAVAEKNALTMELPSILE